MSQNESPTVTFRIKPLMLSAIKSANKEWAEVMGTREPTMTEFILVALTVALDTVHRDISAGKSKTAGKKKSRKTATV
jgi:hypothetical protein